MPQSQSSSAFQALAERLVQEFWDFYPTAGSRIGRHEYDGKLPDLSPVSIRRRVDQLGQGMAFLESAGSGGGNPDEWLSLQLLKLFFKREHFSLTELKPLENNPMRQVGYLNVGGYLLRDYAPLADRLRSATQVMQRGYPYRRPGRRYRPPGAADEHRGLLWHGPLLSPGPGSSGR